MREIRHIINVVCKRQVIPSYDQEGLLWEIMCRELELQNVQQAVPCYGMAIFHDKGHKEHEPDVEIQSTVLETYQDTEHVKFKTVPSVRIASATYKGSYDQVGRVNEAVADWVVANGYDFDGKSFCIYRVSPGETENLKEQVTEVCLSIEEGKRSVYSRLCNKWEFHAIAFDNVPYNPIYADDAGNHAAGAQRNRDTVRQDYLVWRVSYFSQSLSWDIPI